MQKISAHRMCNPECYTTLPTTATRPEPGFSVESKGTLSSKPCVDDEKVPKQIIIINETSFVLHNSFPDSWTVFPTRWLGGSRLRPHAVAIWHHRALTNANHWPSSSSRNGGPAAAVVVGRSFYSLHWECSGWGHMWSLGNGHSSPGIGCISGEELVICLDRRQQ